MFRKNMFRNIRNFRKSCIIIQRKTFLTNEYKCIDNWNKQISSPILTKVNLNDFYNVLDQNYSSKGVISAIDVDIFANAIKDPTYLEELKDLLHKLRLSAETRNTLESTHHATIRKFIEFGNIDELIEILKDPLNFGVFLDNYSANILLDQLITSQNYEQAANIAALVMLQEEYTNDITCTLSQYACYKYIATYIPPIPVEIDEKGKKVEEMKIRVKFLRNPYFDDHFDITDTYILAGKTLAWLSERTTDNINNNLQIIGWLIYKKYDQMLSLVENVSKIISFKVFAEVIEFLEKESSNAESEVKIILDKCISILSKFDRVEISLEESLKNSIENAINRSHNKDILAQQQLFQTWEKMREDKLEEQTRRLDRSKRIQLIQENQKKLKEEEQKLWFFENEEKIDLQIEEKEILTQDTATNHKTGKTSDENYIPPEILPKRK